MLGRATKTADTSNDVLGISHGHFPEVRSVTEPRILIIGGRPTLRRSVTERLRHDGFDVAVFSRTEHAAVGGVTTWTGNVVTGAGLALALDHTDIVISLSRYDGLETAAARTLRSALTRARVRRVIALSDVAAGALPTRRSHAIRRFERHLTTAPTAVTIVRSSLSHQRLRQTGNTFLGRRDLETLRDVVVDPIDEEDIATHLTAMITAAAAPAMVNLVGPERFAVRTTLPRGRHGRSTRRQSSRISGPLQAALAERRHLVTGPVLSGDRVWRDCTSDNNEPPWHISAPRLF